MKTKPHRSGDTVLLLLLLLMERFLLEHQHTLEGRELLHSLPCQMTERLETFRLPQTYMATTAMYLMIYSYRYYHQVLLFLH